MRNQEINEQPRVGVAGWDDVAHMVGEKAELLRGSIPVNERRARIHGVPEGAHTKAADSPLGPAPGNQAEIKAILGELEARDRGESRLADLYPDTGPLRRELYPKHLQHFRAGRDHRDRLFLAGNRVGKSLAAGYEGSLHLTGLYPHWWEGRVFERGINAIAASDTAKTTRDIIQHMLFGMPDLLGTGLIPKNMIRRKSPKHGLSDAYDTIYIDHVSGGVSRLMLKSFDQSVDAFKGTNEDLIWLDEEPPQEVKTECTIRTMTTGGILIVTLTPINGLTSMIDEYLKTCSNRAELPIAA